MVGLTLVLKALGCGRVGYELLDRRDGTVIDGTVVFDAAPIDGTPIVDGAISDDATADATADATTADATTADATVPDATVPDAQEPSPSCTPVGPVSDNFNDGIVASYWTASADSPVVVAESSGRLIITLAESRPGVYYGGYWSKTNYDFRDRCAFVTILDVPRPNEGVEMALQLDTATAQVGMQAEDGLLNIYTWLGAQYVGHASFPLNLVQHRHWRLRENSGTMYWETSADGTNWTIRYSEVTSVNLSSVQLSLFAGTYRSVSMPGTAMFDDFNVP